MLGPFVVDASAVVPSSEAADLDGIPLAGINNSSYTVSLTQLNAQ